MIYGVEVVECGTADDMEQTDNEKIETPFEKVK